MSSFSLAVFMLTSIPEKYHRDDKLYRGEGGDGDCLFSDFPVVWLAVKMHYRNYFDTILFIAQNPGSGVYN